MMTRLDDDVQGLWEEKNQDTSQPTEDDDDFVPAKLVPETPKDELLIRIQL